MKTETGISDRELSTEIREMAKMLNGLLEDASKRGLKVDVSINPHYKNIKTITIQSITKIL